MLIEKDKKQLLLRFTNYKRFDFVSEHSRIISDKGCTWMLKTGKQIPDDRLNELFGKPNTMILKAPKKVGGKYYIAFVEQAYNGQPAVGMNYPSYYDELVEDNSMWAVDSLQGTWFCLTRVEELSADKVSHLRLVSNQRQVDEVLNSTMSAVVYVYSDCDI